MGKYIALYKTARTYKDKADICKQAYNALPIEQYFKFLGYIKKYCL